MDPHAWSWQLLRAGAFRLDGGSMFGIIPRTIWSRWVQPDEKNRIPLHANCLLLDDGTRKVLVETGCGEKWSDKDRAIYAMESRTVIDALAEAGVEPEAIDTVIVTHLHFDHAGGLTRLDASGDAVVAFPNAEVVVQRVEWEDALANKSTMKRTYLRNHLDPIRDRIRLVEGLEEVLPGIRVEPLPGHTWGIQGVFIDTPDNGTLVFPADMMPTAAHVHPAASMGYDMLPYEAMRTKLAFLERAVEGRWRLLLGHEPGDPLATVAGEQEAGFTLDCTPA